MSLSLCPRWRNKMYLFIYLFILLTSTLGTPLHMWERMSCRMLVVGSVILPQLGGVRQTRLSSQIWNFSMDLDDFRRINYYYLLLYNYFSRHYQSNFRFPMRLPFLVKSKDGLRLHFPWLVNQTYTIYNQWWSKLMFVSFRYKTTPYIVSKNMYNNQLTNWKFHCHVNETEL